MSSQIAQRKANHNREFHPCQSHISHEEQERESLTSEESHLFAAIDAEDAAEDAAEAANSANIGSYSQAVSSAFTNLF